MNTKLPCYIVKDLIPNLLDENLSNETVDAVKKHLEQCDECRKEKEDIQKFAGDTTYDDKIIKRIAYISKLNKRFDVVVFFIAGALIPIFIVCCQILKIIFENRHVYGISVAWHSIAIYSLLSGFLAVVIYYASVALMKKQIRNKDIGDVKMPKWDVLVAAFILGIGIIFNIIDMFQRVWLNIVEFKEINILEQMRIYLSFGVNMVALIWPLNYLIIVLGLSKYNKTARSVKYKMSFILAVLIFLVALFGAIWLMQLM